MLTMTPVLTGAAAVLLSLGSGGAAAAEVLGRIASLEGSALISQGAEYVPAQKGMTVRKLDRIVLMEDSSATLSFRDGCTYEMSERSMLTFADKSPCQAIGPGVTASAEHDIVANAAHPTTSRQERALEQAATGQIGAAAAPSIGLGILGAAALGGVIWAATDNDDDGGFRDSRPRLSP